MSAIRRRWRFTGCGNSVSIERLKIGSKRRIIGKGKGIDRSQSVSNQNRTDLIFFLFLVSKLKTLTS